MPATSTDRLYGLTTSVAVKPPCRTVSTGNLTLAGLQTVGGVVLVEGDRVLVRAQTDARQNGIYVADTSEWDRAPDFDGVLDAVEGTLILVEQDGGLTSYWQLTTANPVVIGTSELTFAPSLVDSLGTLSFEPSGAGGTVRSAQAKLREVEVSLQDYGGVPDGNPSNGAANLLACQRALAALPAAGGKIVAKGGTFILSDSFNMRRSNVTFWVDSGAEIKTVAPTSDGHVIAFVEGASYGGSDAAQSINVHFKGGGKITADAGSSDNAVGFTRCKNGSCVGMVLAAGQYAGTAQVNCDEILFGFNRVTTAGAAAISFISASAATGQKDRNNAAIGNVIEASTGYGIYADYFDKLEVSGNRITSAGRCLYLVGQSGDNGANLVGSNNILTSSGDYGAWIDYVNGVDLGVYIAGGAGGLLVKRSDDVRVHGLVTAVTAAESLVIDTITSVLDVDLSITNAPAFVACSITAAAPRNRVRLSVSGSHTYALSTSGQSVNITGSSLGTGSTGLYSGTIPVGAGVVVDGSAYVLPSPATAFANGDTTPAVTGKEWFTTANAGATAVINFDSGVDGQVIEIYAGDGNTTLMHASGGGNIRNQRSGGANRLLAIGNIYRYRNNGGLWYEEY